MLSDKAKDELVRRLESDKEEGYRQYAYDDKTGKRVAAPYGKLTIGIGWNISDGVPIELARIVARYFVDRADADLSSHHDFYDSLDEVRQSVLADMVYNLGINRFDRFTDTISALKGGKYFAAAKEMRDSEWYREVPRRAECLAKAMETGKFE